MRFPVSSQMKKLCHADQTKYSELPCSLLLKYMRRAHGILYLWWNTKPVKMNKKQLFFPT